MASRATKNHAGKKEKSEGKAAKDCAELKKAYRNTSGMEVAALYRPEDIRDLDYARDLGYPGEYPYTRGVHTSMYRGRTWTMRQFSGMGTPAETNRRYHFLLERGQTGLSVAFDMPTIMGYDSDHPRSHGEIGHCGVAIDSLRDMEIMLDGIPLDKISTSMTINGPAAVLLAYYIGVGIKQGVPSQKLRGTIQNDILKEYIAQKSWIFPPRPSMRIITDILAYCAGEVPQWNTISISGYHIREAGATALQELAFTLADGFAYVEAGIAAGLDVDTFSPRLSFFFDCHNNFFEEVAKFRAARRIWAKKMKEVYHAKDPHSFLLRFHTQTAGCTLVAQQPENNIVRVAYQALAAVLGGTQSLHTNSMDETLALPSEKAVQIALRTQQIVAHETGAPDTVDPLAGSYYVEHLTNWMEEECEKYFERINSEGGVLECIDKGFLQREIARSAYAYQRAIDSREQIIVGVNDYVIEEEKIGIPLLKLDPETEKKKVKDLKKLKNERDQKEVSHKLDEIKAAAKGTENLMPRIKDAAMVYCTEGEIIDALREVFGAYREPIIF